MASFFSKLFGRSGTSENQAQAAPGKAEAYADCTIRATPMREGSQFRLAGSIEKVSPEGAAKVRNFIRADLFTSEQDAIDAALRKGRQIIDQTGPSLFSDEAQSRQV
ncbi:MULTISPECIES: HlyU family transcriptional regulator [unclassified Ensifer]|uniref:HlyU family transcriptional regulator n=1 Tax=unclassified Ensifer TaxID=2633371 RepID=UPI00081310CB|nr:MULTISPECIES: HlyU family transcriptional regulator [unclassified Ensifer]OCP01025.1 transcriptional activator HlyU [Ensifer sp. LC11]OCP01599.1 transcriptional activator HlyU [Ensifer sp. LC13]OCP02147.1 transcriptional activator HlyU [Ensifer sp. LC14]OCP30021.1 transcriptional activator HlyU [Ensifer sp. LC499]